MNIYSRIIYEIDSTQIRLTINEWNDIEYLHLRKYYLDFDGNWLPSKDGISMPLNINNTKEMFIALVEILSLAESKNILEENFKDVLDYLYQ